MEDIKSQHCHLHYKTKAWAQLLRSETGTNIHSPQSMQVAQGMYDGLGRSGITKGLLEEKKWT